MKMVVYYGITTWWVALIVCMYAIGAAIYASIPVLHVWKGEALTSAAGDAGKLHFVSVSRTSLISLSLLSQVSFISLTFLAFLCQISLISLTFILPFFTEPAGGGLTFMIYFWSISDVFLVCFLAQQEIPRQSR